jgi:cyclase
MLRKRIIPSLLVDSAQHLVKTTKFSDRVYLGDPRNASYVFSGFEADEILLLDIDATSDARPPNFELIRSISQFSSVPLAVGGGIRSLEHIQSIIAAGVERVVLGSILSHDPLFLYRAVQTFGSSSISVIINCVYHQDCKSLASFGTSFSTTTIHSVYDLAHYCFREGAGEVILYDVEADGTRRGFNIDLFASISCTLPIPVIAIGGGDNAHDVSCLLNSTDVAGAALGSSFVYAPNTHQVLINYPHLKARVFG